MSDQIKPVAKVNSGIGGIEWLEYPLADDEKLYCYADIYRLQDQNARLLNSLVWMRGRLTEYGLNLMSHSKYEKMNSDIKLLDAIIAEAGNAQ